MRPLTPFKQLWIFATETQMGLDGSGRLTVPWLAAKWC